MPNARDKAHRIQVLNKKIKSIFLENIQKFKKNVCS